MASGWKSHDREEAQLYPARREHHPCPLPAAPASLHAPVALPLGAKGTTCGGGVGFVFWSTGSRGGFWAPNTRKSKRALGASGLDLSPGPGTSKLSDLCEPPSLCEGHSGIWHPFLEQRLGAGHAGHRGHQENPVVHCSSLVFLSLYVLVSHGCSSKSPSNLLT